MRTKLNFLTLIGKIAYFIGMLLLFNFFFGLLFFRFFYWLFTGGFLFLLLIGLFIIGKRELFKPFKNAQKEATMHSRQNHSDVIDVEAEVIDKENS